MDRQHVDLLRPHTEIIDIRLPGAGHSTVDYLSSLGLLRKYLPALADGSFDPQQFESEARRRRKESSYFFVTLADRARSPEIRAAWARRATQCSPIDAVTLARCATYAAQVGRREEALATIARAEASGSNNPFVRLMRARVFEFLGELDEAIALVESLCARNGAVPVWRWYLRHMKLQRLLRRLPNWLAGLGAGQLGAVHPFSSDIKSVRWRATQR